MKTTELRELGELIRMKTVENGKVMISIVSEFAHTSIDIDVEDLNYSLMSQNRELLVYGKDSNISIVNSDDLSFNSIHNTIYLNKGDKVVMFFHFL